MLFHLKQNRCLVFLFKFLFCPCKGVCHIVKKSRWKGFFPHNRFFVCFFEAAWTSKEQRAKSIHITFPSPLVFFTCSYFKSLMLDYISCNKILKYKIIIDLLLTPPSNCVESSNVIKCSPVKTMCTITGSIGIKRLCSSQVLLIRCT